MRKAIQEIAVGPDRGRDISKEHARRVMQSILSGEEDDVQSAVFLIALRMKRESQDEFSGLLEALQNSVTPVTADVAAVHCLADPFNGYSRTVSVTPFLPPVLAANGVPALLHGVETVGPKHGVTAHKVYRLAGMNPLHSLADAAAQLGRIACTYVDQRVYAPALYHLQGLRDRIVKRTALTTLERVLLPIRGKVQTHLVLGYVHKAYPEIYTRAAEQAGYNSVLLVKGVEGGVAPALNKPLRRFFFDLPASGSVDQQKQIVDIQRLNLSTVAPVKMSATEDAVEQTLQLGLDMLNGQHNMARDSLLLSAGQVLSSYLPDTSITQAVEKVQNCLDNGSALTHFEAMISNS